MAEVQRITEYIINKANDEATRITNEAQKECSEIISNAKKEADKIRNKILSEANIEAENIEKRAYSVLNQKKSSMILEIKNKVIDEVISKAKNEILELSDKEYNDFLLRILRRNTTGQAGSIGFNKKDLERLSKELKALIKSKNLTVEKEPCNIVGGFILRYGSVIINSSIEAIFKEKREEFIDCVNRSIFG